MIAITLPHVFPFQGQIDREVAAAQEEFHVIVVERPVDLAVGEQKSLRVCVSLISEPERLAHDAMCPVGPDEIYSR